MENLAIDLLLILIFILIFYKDKNAPEEDYLSRKYTNIVKGVLAIFVILHHLSQRISSGKLFFSLTVIGYLLVALFFFYSGYGIMTRYNNDKNYPKTFLRKRLPAIIIPYAIVTLLCLLMYNIIGYHYGLLDIFTIIFTGEPMVPFSWYIITIICFYFYFYFIMNIFKEQPKKVILGAFSFSLFWIILCQLLKFGSWWYNTSHLLGFGMYYAFYEEAFIKKLENHHYGIFFTIFFTLSFISMFIHPTLTLVIQMITGVYFVLLVLAISRKYQLNNKLLVFLGSISFELYLIQGLWITSLRNEAFYLKSDLLFCLITLLGSMISAYLFKQLNSMILKKRK